MDNQDSFKERSNRKLTELRSQVEYLNMKMLFTRKEACSVRSVRVRQGGLRRGEQNWGKNAQNFI